MIVQNIAADEHDRFHLHRESQRLRAGAGDSEERSRELGAREVTGDTKIAKVSLVGVGMRSHAGVASKMFETLANEGINIRMISTSEIKISVVVDEKYLELGGARAA